MARKWQKTAIFSCNFDLFLAVFIDCHHIYVPNGMKWGSTSSPHIGDIMMSFFSLWGRPFMTGDGLKMVHFGPKRAKHGRLVNTPKWSKRVRKGPKWSTTVFLTIRNLFGPILALLDRFKQELIFCSEAPLPTPTLSIWGKKIIFV